MEQHIYDACGQLLTSNRADYLIPTTTDFPKIRAFALETTGHRAIRSSQGRGEGAIIPIAPMLGLVRGDANHRPLSPARGTHNDFGQPTHTEFGMTSGAPANRVVIVDHDMLKRDAVMQIGGA